MDRELSEQKMNHLCMLIYTLKRWKQILITGIVVAIASTALYYLCVEVIPGRPDYVKKGIEYVTFEPDYLAADQYYNAYTWGQIAESDLIAGFAKEELNDAYSIETVRKSVEIVMMSDVRVITLVVRAHEKADAEAIYNAMVNAFTHFGEVQREFVSISLIEDNEAVIETRDLLCSRVFIFSGLGGLFFSILFFILRFMLADGLYTMEECRRRFQIPCLGMLNKDNKWLNEEEWNVNSKYLNAKNITPVIIYNNKTVNVPFSTLSDETLWDKLKNNKCIDLSLIENIDHDKLQSSLNILVVQWGSNNGANIEHFIEQLKVLDIQIDYFVLYGANNSFLKYYYKHRSEDGK